jgi:hypothetical protein
MCHFFSTGMARSRGACLRVVNKNNIWTLYVMSYLLTVLLPWILFGAARLGLRHNSNTNQTDDIYGSNSCSWWQWSCNSSNQQQQQTDDTTYTKQQQQYTITTPWWWWFPADAEKHMRESHGDSTNPTVVLVYAWTLIVLTALFYFGRLQDQRGADLYRVVVGFLVFAQMSFTQLTLIGGLEGAVQTHGKELNEQGFYGQFGVMTWMTSCFSFFASVGWAMHFYGKARRAEKTIIELDEADYQVHNPNVPILNNDENHPV